MLSGGGSGHEPMHGGFVGTGMLDAACPGEVFTSPTPDQMSKRPRRPSTAAPASSTSSRTTPAMCSTSRRPPNWPAAEGIAGRGRRHRRRRGRARTASTPPAGAASAPPSWRRRSSAPPPRRATTWRRSRRSAGGSTPAAGRWAWPSPPARCRAAGKPTFELGDDEMEIGIGIHGEPGRERLPLEPADEIVERLPSPILEDLPYASRRRGPRFRQQHGRDAAARALPRLRRAGASCSRDHGIEVARSLIGTYITSLEMAGMSITLLRIDDEMIRSGTRRCTRRGCAGALMMAAADDGSGMTTRSSDWRRGVGRRRARDAKDELTELDSAIGDADTAPTWTAASRRSCRSSTSGADKDIARSVKTVGMTLISKVGGAGGPALRDAVPAFGGDRREDRKS